MLKRFSRGITLLVVLCASSISSAFQFTLPDLPLGPVETPNQAETQDTNDDGMIHIRGSATKGPIANAGITVYEIDDVGNAIGSAIASTTTDSSGDFTLALPAFNGLLLVTTSGGSFLDESDTRPLSQRRRIFLAQNQGFSSIIEPGQEVVAITPFTDALVERGRIGGRLGGFSDIMKDLIDTSTDGFGFSLFATEPPNPASPTGADSAQLQYGLLLGAVANIANTVSLKMGLPKPTYAVIKALVSDISDGDVDGMLDGGPIFVGGKRFPAVNFEWHLMRFRNNNYASYGSTTLPEWEDADQALGLRFPATFFATIQNSGDALVFGIGAFPFGKVVLNPNGTGTFSDYRGAGQFRWAGTGYDLVLDFSDIGGFSSRPLKSNVIDPSTQQVLEREVTYTLDRMELLQGTNDNGDEVVFANRQARITIKDLTNNQVNVFPAQTQRQLTIYDLQETIPFDGVFDREPALPAFNSQALTLGEFVGPFGQDIDRMSFLQNGTGTTVYENESFSWEIMPDGHLRVDFTNGETADYYILLQDDPEIGDYVAVDYTRAGNAFHFGSVVLEKDPAAEWTRDLITGIYESPGGKRVVDGQFLIDSGTYRHYPDGTGINEFPTIDPATGDVIIFASFFANCWDIDSEGYFVRKRVLTLPGQFGRGRLPNPSDCQTVSDSVVEFKRVHDIFEINGDEISTVIQYFDDDCFGSAFITPDCGPATIRFGVNPARYRKTGTYTGVPPILARDYLTGSVSEPTSFNPLSNDLAGDFPIDTTTMAISNGPYEYAGPNGLLVPSGEVSVNPATGAVTYTPESGDLRPRTITFNYQVQDSQGNVSHTELVFLNLLTDEPEPPPPPPPEVPALALSTASIFGEHFVGDSPCPDPFASFSVFTENETDFTIDSLTVSGDIDGFIEVFHSTGGPAASHVIDVEFNCASADAAVRTGDILISGTHALTGEPVSIMMPVTHEVIPPVPALLLSPNSISDEHFVGDDFCPDQFASFVVQTDDGSNFSINSVSVTGTINGFVEAFPASTLSAPSHSVDLQFNCSSSVDAIRTGNVIVNGTHTPTGSPISVAMPVTHQVTNGV